MVVLLTAASQISTNPEQEPLLPVDEPEPEVESEPSSSPEPEPEPTEPDPGLPPELNPELRYCTQ